MAHWNVLNDWNAQPSKKLAGYKKQVDRLDDIARKIAEVRGESARFLIFLCEIIEPTHAEYLARNAGLLAIGDPTVYMTFDDIDQHGIFLADEETRSIAVQEVTAINGSPDKMIGVDVGGLGVVGCHQRRLWTRSLITDIGLRKSSADEIKKRAPDIVVGDWNALPFFPLRLGLVRAGYSETHREDRPIFPNEYFRGKNIRSSYPDISIDAMYHRDSVRPLRSGYGYSTGADHPILSADFEYQLDVA